MDSLISAASVIGVGDGSGPGWIHITDGHIRASGRGAPPRLPDENFADGLLVPGLIDAQINGAYGLDFANATEVDFARIVDMMPETGVTAIVPTFITAPIDELARSLRRYDALRAKFGSRSGGSRLLPCHIEGPFLAANRRGAHREELLIDPTREQVRELIEAGGGSFGYVTLAPERNGAMEAVTSFVDAGVRVSIGHSDAEVHTVAAAADRGATLVTHVFNAQRPFSHRDPGVVGGALVDTRLTLGLIVDLHHVDEVAVRLAFAAAPGRIMLVTDAVAAMGMPPGTYDLGGEEIVVPSGAPPRRNDGTLAGSSIRLDEAIGHAVSCGISVVEAVDAATRTPARALGMNNLGHLRRGACADFTVLDSTDYRARHTWIAGDRVS